MCTCMAVLWGIGVNMSFGGFTSSLQYSVVNYLAHSDFLQTVTWHQILFDSYIIYVENIPY